jgi:hypothetical protein
VDGSRSFARVVHRLEHFGRLGIRPVDVKDLHSVVTEELHAIRGHGAKCSHEAGLYKP